MKGYKLVLRNVRRHLQDYSIYFFTLVLAVSLFYAFGAINDQPALQDLGMTKQLLADQLEIFITLLSVVIAIVLAFLILYANAFLLKRRKKEIGMYILLGMTRGRIARIFSGETVLVSGLALMFGLGLGIALSQGLSLVALRLFAVELDRFRLVFSSDALLRTIFCFVLIDCIVMTLNSRSIAKLSIIHLLSAQRINYEINCKRSRFQYLVLLLSCCSIAGALILVNHYGILPSREHHGLEMAAVLLACGLIGFFYSLSSLVLAVVQKRDALYLKRLNSVLSRQISSKLRSDFLTLAVVCGLLIIAASGLTVGASSALTMNAASKAALPFNLNVISDVDLIGETDIATYLEGRGVDINAIASEKAQISIYESTLTYGDLFSEQNVDLWPIDSEIPDLAVTIISLSDFNRSLSMQGKAPLHLKEGTCMMNCNYEGTRTYIEAYLRTHEHVTVNGSTLQFAADEPLAETYWMTSVGNNDRGTLIVPDDVVNGLHKDANILLVNYLPETDNDAVLQQMIPIGLEWETEGYRYTERDMLNDMYYGTGALLVFVCCYIGLVFLLVCAVLLSLKQLTEMADSVSRYTLLRKLGAPETWLSRMLLRQCAVFFLAPLILASALSAFVVNELMVVVEEFMNMHIASHIGLTAGLFLLVYGGYYLATYFCCRRLLLEEKREG